MKVVTNAVWLSSCRLAADLLSFVLFAVISRQFGPAGVGEYSYASAIASLVALLCTAGYEEFGIRQYVRASDNERVHLWTTIVVSQKFQLAFGLFLLICFFVFLHEDQAPPSIIVGLCIYQVGWGLSRTFFVPAMAEQAMVAPAIAELICRVSSVVVALAIIELANNTSLPVALIGFPLGGIVLATLAWRNSKRHRARSDGKASLADVKAMVKHTSPFAASELLNQFYARTDLLLIAQLLTSVQVGLYATDVKFVEVGLLPLVTIGSAAYPLLSRMSAEPGIFQDLSRDFARAVLFLAGWLAIGIIYFVPMTIVPLFGPDFAPAKRLLPFFALLAIAKGGELALYRLLYSLRRQHRYVIALSVATVTMVILNIALIPIFKLEGAVLSGIASIAIVVIMCAFSIRDRLALRRLGLVMLRLAAAIVATIIVGELLRRLNGSMWIVAIVPCLVFPVAAFVVGLIPNPRRSLLFNQNIQSDVTATG